MVGSAVDRIIEKSPDPQVRQRAFDTKIESATAMYDIAADPVPATAMVNAIVVVSIQANFLRSHPDEFGRGHHGVHAARRVSPGRRVPHGGTGHA